MYEKYMSNAIQTCVKWKMEKNGIVQLCYIGYSTDDDAFGIREMYSQRT